MTVLVIDDDARVRTLLRDIVLLTGHKVIEASDGHSGLKYIEQGGFDIVFTDLGMPGITGWEVAGCVKQKHPEIPVILVTGWGPDVDQAKVRELGIDSVIGKPFEIEDIIGTVTYFLNSDRVMNDEKELVPAAC